MGDGVNAGAYSGVTAEQISNIIADKFPEDHEFRKAVKVQDVKLAGESYAMWSLPKDQYIMLPQKADQDPWCMFKNGLKELGVRRMYTRAIHVGRQRAAEYQSGISHTNSIVSVPSHPDVLKSRKRYSAPVTEISDGEPVRLYPTGLLRGNKIPTRCGAYVSPRDEPGFPDFLDALGIEDIVV